MSVRNCILGSKRSWWLWPRNWTRCIRRQNPEWEGEGLIRHAPNRLEPFVILPIGLYLGRAEKGHNREQSPYAAQTLRGHAKRLLNVCSPPRRPSQTPAAP